MKVKVMCRKFECRKDIHYKALIKRERKSSQVFRKLACDDLRCHRSNVGTSRHKFWTSASVLYI